MSYQNTGGYQNVPTDGNQAAGPGAPSAADASMSYPNPNANTNNNTDGGNGGNPQHPLQQQQHQHQQVNQQQVHQQQQQFQNPPNQAFNGSAGRVYNMPTYHQYSNGNPSDPNSNIYGGGGQGMPPMGNMPSTYNDGSSGNYGPNIGSAAWSQYMRQSKRNRILVTVLVTVFVLYLFSPGSGSGSGSANGYPHNAAAASAGANAGANNLSLETVAKNEDAVTNYQHSSGIPGDGLKPTASASNASSSTTTNLPDADMEMAGDGDLTTLSESSPSARFAYLLTYPMSGTSYSMYLASKSTHKAIGTNYAIYGQQGEDGYAMPILKSALSSSEPASSSKGKQKQVKKHTDSNKSPYWWRFTYSKMDKPDPSTDIILVNTHCSGHCMYPCAPEEFLIAPEPFEETCRLVIGAPPTYHVSLTPQADVAKIIHLLRDPYSNVVSRFHSWRREAKAAHIDKSRIHADDVDGFHAWCKDMDNNEVMDTMEILSPQITVAVKEIMLNVPCHQEFYKYVAWHNNVNSMAWMDNVKSMEVYYEDFADASKQKKIATLMAEFLGTPLSSSESDAASTLPDFLKVRMYGDWFTAEEKKNVETLVRTLAIKPAMPLLERYFGNNSGSRHAKDEEVGKD